MLLFGHEEKIQTFSRVLKDGTLGHAYLFFGDAEIGKFTFAKLLAYALEFGKFEERTEPLVDALFISPDLESSSISIDAVRAIKNFVWQTPARSHQRLVVMDGAEALTDEAEGALLKVVEEPPQHATLIFIAQDTQVLLPPLLSRLTKVYFERLSKTELVEVLVDHFNVPRENAKKTAEESFGRVGRALALLGRTKRKQENPYLEVERAILNYYYEKGMVQHAPLLSWLLDREMKLKRYNLNMQLQTKAIREKISHDHS